MANDKITAVQFAGQNSFSNRDKATVKRMYGTETKTANQWEIVFKKKFNYKNK